MKFLELPTAKVLKSQEISFHDVRLLFKKHKFGAVGHSTYGIPTGPGPVSVARQAVPMPVSAVGCVYLPP